MEGAETWNVWKG